MIGRFAILAALAIGIFLIVAYFRSGNTEGIGEPLAIVKVPTLTTEQQKGELAFNASCASCHGVNAVGKYGLGPPLVHNVYEPSHHGDGAFLLAAKQGVRQHHWYFGSMPPQPDVTDDQIQSIIGYVRTLQRANGIE